MNPVTGVTLPPTTTRCNIAGVRRERGPRSPIPGPVHSNTIAGLTNGTPYQVRVAAKNSVVTGPYTPPETATPTPTLPTPAAPANFIANVGGGAWVYLYWDSQDGIDRYQIDSRLPGGQWEENVYTGPGLPSGDDLRANLRRYPCDSSRQVAVEFMIKAHGDGTTFSEEWGPYSEASVDMECPPMPSGFTATMTYGASVDLGWNSGSGLENYRVLYRTFGASGWTWASGEIPPTSTSYTVTGLNCGTSYRLAVGALGDSSTYARRWSQSAILSATTDDCEVSFGTSTYSVTEGEDLDSITVRLSSAPGRDVAIPISVVQRGTTAESADYTVPSSVIVDGDRTSKDFTVETNEDTDCDDETLILGFGTLPSGVSADSPSTATVTIDDDDTCAITVSGERSISSPENATGTLDTYSANRSGVTWSLSGVDDDDFNIDSNGNLGFVTPPNFEDPQDSDSNNEYELTVTASKTGYGNGTLDVIVRVTNRSPTITSGQSSVNYAEGGTGSVGTYSASDPGGGSISWSLPNTSFETDRGDFDISSRGVVTFDDTPDYEDPDDHNDDNVYRITVRASDSSGGTTDRNVTVTVTNRNPTFDSGDPSVSYAECRTNLVERYTASDPGGGRITWSLTGEDAGDFRISSGGVLRFRSTPNHEDPDDDDENNEYLVTVKASDTDDDSGLSADQDVMVTVTNRSPTFDSGDSSVNYAEGGTDPVETYSASDPCGGSISPNPPKEGVGSVS